MSTACGPWGLPPELSASVHVFPDSQHLAGKTGIILRTTPGVRAQPARESHGRVTSAGSLYRRCELPSSGLVHRTPDRSRPAASPAAPARDTSRSDAAP